jgi:PAS domain S-box-containing protein
MLDALLTQSPVAFALVDTDVRLRRVSRSLAEMIGTTPAEQVGHTPAEVWPPALAASAESAVRKVLADGMPVSDALPGGIGNGGDAGRDTQIALSWFPAHGPDGTVTGVTMIAQDIVGEAASAEAVRRTRERYRSLVQAGNQVVWVTNPAGEVAEDSPEWRWITGQSVEDYLADGWLAAIHPNDRDRIERDWRDCIRTGTVFDGSYRVRTKTGSYRHYDVRAVPIERDGAIIEWMGASTDVTGQREADEMRGRLTEQLSAAALRTSRLQQATSLLAEALSVKEVMTVITEVGRSAIGADRSAVAMVVDTDRLRLRVMTSDASGDPGELSAEIPVAAPSVVSAAIGLRRSLVFGSPESLRRHFDADGDVELALQHADEQAWVGLPLTTSGAPFGALQFSFTTPHQITDEERVFLEALAGQGALALERATMYEREHATAETLQHSLLPDTLPEVPGIALEATYKPVSREVGGDWYDAFRLPDGKLAVAAGDVMGKGLTAAAGMGRVRNALRALALTDPRPAAVLAGLDRLFIATELDEQVTTVCYLVVDPQTGEGVAGNAGHLPPLLLGPGMLPKLDLTEPGTPLGWASPRRQYPFRLPPGNTAVLYSDGLVENRRRGLDAGLDELVAVAGRAPRRVVSDPRELIDYLVEAMMTGYEQDDDVTVLVLQMPEQRSSGRAAGAVSQGRTGRGRGRS